MTLSRGAGLGVGRGLKLGYYYWFYFVLFKTPGWYRAQPLQEALVRGGHMVEGVGCHLASAVVAGVTATMVASPVDVVKTRSASRLELNTKSTRKFVIIEKAPSRTFSWLKVEDTIKTLF